MLLCNPGSNRWVQSDSQRYVKFVHHFLPLVKWSALFNKWVKAIKEFTITVILHALQYHCRQQIDLYFTFQSCVGCDTLQGFGEVAQILKFKLRLPAHFPEIRRRGNDFIHIALFCICCQWWLIPLCELINYISGLLCRWNTARFFTGCRTDFLLIKQFRWIKFCMNLIDLLLDITWLLFIA